MASGIPGKVNEPEYRVEESHYGRHDSTEDSSSSRKIFMILGIPDNCKPNNLERFMVNEAKQRQIPLQKLRIHIQGRETYGQRAYASLFLLENAETAGKTIG